MTDRPYTRKIYIDHDELKKFWDFTDKVKRTKFITKCTHLVGGKTVRIHAKLTQQEMTMLVLSVKLISTERVRPNQSTKTSRSLFQT